MPKLITFDGPSASGKFTQSVKLCEHLGVERVNDSMFTLLKNQLDLSIYSDPMLRPILWASIVRFSYAFDWQKRGIFTLGGFWQYIIDFLSWTDGIDFNVILDALDTIILEQASDVYPVCSFYLNVSDYETKVRFLGREAKLEKLEGDVEITGLSASDSNKKRDEILTRVSNFLSDRYPFFHVIDGSRSEDEVFDEIVRLAEAVL